MRLPEGDLICEGIEAYAKQQAVYELSIAQSWEEHWLPVQQWAKPLLQRLFGEAIPDGLDVGDVMGDSIIINLEDNKEIPDEIKKY